MLNFLTTKIACFMCVFALTSRLVPAAAAAMLNSSVNETGAANERRNSKFMKTRQASEQGR